MSRTIDIQKARLKFPRVCVVCLAPSAQDFTIQHTARYGRSSMTVMVSVPMCELDYQNAMHKSLAERLVGRAGVLLGLAAWVAASYLLMVHWADTGQENLILNLFSASIFGFGLFLILWALISVGLAPVFADPESKQARNAVRITRYWPKDQYLRLEFQNESLAETVAKESNTGQP